MIWLNSFIRINNRPVWCRRWNSQRIWSHAIALWHMENLKQYTLPTLFYILIWPFNHVLAQLFLLCIPQLLYILSYNFEDHWDSFINWESFILGLIKFWLIRCRWFNCYWWLVSHLCCGCRGAAAPTYYLARFRRKLHENEENLTGGVRPNFFLCISATGIYIIHLMPAVWWTSVADPWFPMGRQSQRGLPTYYSANFFPKNAWKYRKLGRGNRILAPTPQNPRIDSSQEGHQPNLLPKVTAYIALIP